MRRKVAALLPLLALTAFSYGPADTGVVNVSNTPDYSEGEEPLSISPLNPAYMATVANVFQPNAPKPLDVVLGGGGMQDTRVYTTRDGGLHWTTRKLDQGGLGEVPNPLPPALGFAPEFSDALNIVNTDADSVWDRYGNVFFESGDIRGIHHGGDEQANLWWSTDGGLKWAPPNGTTAVSANEEGNELDRPWLAIDNSGGPRDGTLYMTFETTAFVQTPPEVYVKRSTDHGRTWSATVRVDDGTYQTQFNARQRPVVGADGTLYVVYDRAPVSVTPFTEQLAPIALAVARSSDGGQTFERSVVDDNVHRISSPDEALPSYTEMISAIATDPKHPGRIAVAWPEALSAASSRIVLRVSVDGGKSWGSRIDVPDDPASGINQHDHVSLAWLADGPLFVGWRDRRCCGGAWNAHYQQFVRALQIDPAGLVAHGATVEFSDGPQLSPTGSGRGILQPDEFQGLVASPLGVGLSWSQLNGPYDDLFFRRVPLSAWGLGTPKCVRKPRLVVRLHVPVRRRIVRATAYVNGKKVLARRGHALKRISLRTPRKRLFTLRIVAITNRGGRIITVRRFRGCK